MLYEVITWVLDLGPGAGLHGGELVAVGTPEEIAASAEALTGRYLRGEVSVPVPKQRRRGNGARLRVEGARHHRNNFV